ncbi:hypothetical protein MLP_20950 [Microlunatus phosphovorus NM-1]|uniref:Uncharacterized protein n=1 Tax=Microlunatus phosphovorus (strain ATCC 700054 / DSM 10555 / JCM 9379 / NBRC 101784 / NCIMB 13414 / VKM Ac-1990 / NM-1) TaxID=1032480 RepID=F5XDT6_MICPN|nr:hypothetical protein MLP_20950 [Microlunatus phosphovorus NM-1]
MDPSRCSSYSLRSADREVRRCSFTSIETTSTHLSIATAAVNRRTASPPMPGHPIAGRAGRWASCRGIRAS